MAILKPPAQVKFDPKNIGHLREYLYFLENGRWRNSCPFECAEEDLSTPHRIAFVLAEHYARQRVQAASRPAKSTRLPLPNGIAAHMGGGVRPGELVLIAAASNVGRTRV